SVLDHVLGVFLVMRDVLRDPEDIAVIPLHQLAESVQITLFGSLDQRQFAGDTFFGPLLDGFHAAPTQFNLLCSPLPKMKCPKYLSLDLDVRRNLLLRNGSYRHE